MTNLGPKMDGWKWDALGRMMVPDIGKAETIVDPGFSSSVWKWMYNRCPSLYLSARDRGWS